MFKHILIPTDGSELAAKAIEAGIAFARDAGARVTGFTAVPEYPIPNEVDLMAKRVVSMYDYERGAKARAEETLQPLTERAGAAGVDCDTDFALSNSPYEAIIDAAERHGCDLIFIASHGRRGISALLYGSETQGVLTHCKIPTLVYR